MTDLFQNFKMEGKKKNEEKENDCLITIIKPSKKCWNGMSNIHTTYILKYKPYCTQTETYPPSYIALYLHDITQFIASYISALIYR